MLDNHSVIMFANVILYLLNLANVIMVRFTSPFVTLIIFLLPEWLYLNKLLK